MADTSLCGVQPSLLERFFAKYEFTCRYQLSCSNCESWTTKEVLEESDVECQDLWDNASLGYTETLGHPKLLEAIWHCYRPALEDRCRKRSITLPASLCEQQVVNITVCVPVEGIYIAMSQLLGPKDVVIAMTPAYQALTEIARSRSCELWPWTPQWEEGDFWNFRLEDLKALLQKCHNMGKVLKMLIINSPHNPTGVVFNQSDLDQIFQWLEDLQQEEMPILFSDEMYSALMRDAPTNVGRPNAIVLSGLSKPFGMPGLRMGWLIMENRAHFEKVIALRDYTTLCMPVHSEILSIITLRNAASFLRRNQAICKENYRILQDFLLRMPDWFYPLEQQHQCTLEWCASTVFPRLKMPGKLQGQLLAQLSTPTLLAEHLASEYGVCMIVSDLFEFHCPCVRFGLGLKSFPESLEALEKALQDLGFRAQAAH